jgi:hypothetical protein
VFPVPNAAGWNDTDVIVIFICVDSLSGVAQCPAPSVVSTDGANQVISRTTQDRAGNTGQQRSARREKAKSSAAQRPTLPGIVQPPARRSMLTRLLQFLLSPRHKIERF